MNQCCKSFNTLNPFDLTANETIMNIVNDCPATLYAERHENNNTDDQTAMRPLCKKVKFTWAGQEREWGKRVEWDGVQVVKPHLPLPPYF